MGFGSIGGFNPNLNAYGAGNVKKPAEGEQQGETKAPELNMAETKGAETKTDVALNGLDALAAQGRANLGKSLQVTGEINGTDAPVVTQEAKGRDWGVISDPVAWEEAANNPRSAVKEGDTARTGHRLEGDRYQWTHYEIRDGRAVITKIEIVDC